MGHMFAALKPLCAHWIAQAGSPAQSVAPAAQGFSAQEGLVQALPIAAMFAVVYFLLIRPQQAQRNQQMQLLAALKKDDEVITQGGILGRIVALDEAWITLEVADKVRIRVQRDRIAGLYVKKD